MLAILNRNGGSRTDTLVKLVLIFFISLLSFSVGTYVGKQVSDNDHRRAQVEGDYQGVASQEENHADAESAEKAEEEKLSDDEIASLTEEFVTKEKDAAAQPVPAEVEREVASQPAEDTAGYKKFSGKNAPSHTAAPVEKTVPAAKTPASTAQAAPEMTKPAPAPVTEVVKPIAATDAPAAAAHRVAQGQAPAPDMKAPRKPDSILPSVAATAVGKYTVQVASYPDEAQAKNHAAELKGKGWNAFYIPAEIQGKNWYRVSVGLFTSAKSAGEFRKEFQKESNVATAIVQKIIK
jgi:septal ring-binding cell division protein DamX